MLFADGKIVWSEIRTPSLRANGSRECAPDDRLREAIHSVFLAALWNLRFAMMVQNPLLPGCLKIESATNERLTTGIVAVCACASQTRLA
jgi:hypothetical protein